MTLAAARVAPNEPGRQSSLLMRQGTMTLRYYAPRGVDTQTPHVQDEIYMVQSGSGYFLNGPNESQLERRSFGPGDAIFVRASYVHRFVDFTNDFGTWVVFWGPSGGEVCE
jgi:oxalate decarboxylase/phosphoglucose isomerase-like protein (cupin superfamily)